MKQDFLEKLITYLADRPYKETAFFINELQKEYQKQTIPSNPNNQGTLREVKDEN